MSILCHKGIALSMLSLLWLTEKLQTLDKNMIISGLSHEHKQLRKYCTKLENLESTLAHPKVVFACQSCSEIRSV